MGYEGLVIQALPYQQLLTRSEENVDSCCLQIHLEYTSSDLLIFVFPSRGVQRISRREVTVAVKFPRSQIIRDFIAELSAAELPDTAS